MSKRLLLPQPVLSRGDSANGALYCLPLGGVDVLLAMVHRMKWGIYVGADGQKVALTDAEEAIVDETIGGLLMPCTIDFSELADAIRSIQISQQQTQTQTCGSGGTFICYDDDGQPIVNPGPIVDPIEDPELPPPDGGYPDPIIPGEGDPPPGYVDWDEFDEAACKMANAAVDILLTIMRRTLQFFTSDLFALVALVVAVANLYWGAGLALLFSRAYIVRVATLWWQIATNGYHALVVQAIEETIEYVEDNRQTLVCALYAQRGNIAGWDLTLLSAISGGLAVMFLNLGDYTFKSFLQWLLPRGTIYQAILTGLIAGPGYTGPVDCGECEEEPAPPDGYILVPIPHDHVSYLPNNNSAELVYESWPVGRFRHDPLTSLNYHEVDATFDVSSVLDYYPYIDSLVGLWVGWEVASGTGPDIAFPNAVGSLTAVDAVMGRTAVSYDGTEYANVQAFADWIDSFAHTVNYGNGPMLPGFRNTWRSRSYGEGGSAGRHTYRLYLIARRLVV